MTRADARVALVTLLRLFGMLDLLALLAVIMPHAWMEIAHNWAGLGEMPDVPLVHYLTRSNSTLYALHGALILLVSVDVDRYARLVTFLGAGAFVHGAMVLGIDVYANMPLFWTVLEGPALMGIGVGVLVVQRMYTTSEVQEQPSQAMEQQA